MKEFQNLNLFIEKFNTKNLHTTFLSISGVGTSKIKRLVLVGGFDKMRMSTFKKNSNSMLPLVNNVQLFQSFEKGKIANSISRKVRAKSYQGMRHTLRLPVRGQRTHTNSKTARRNVKK